VRARRQLHLYRRPHDAHVVPRQRRPRLLRSSMMHRTIRLRILTCMHALTRTKFSCASRSPAPGSSRAVDSGQHCKSCTTAMCCWVGPRLVPTPRLPAGMALGPSDRQLRIPPVRVRHGGEAWASHTMPGTIQRSTRGTPCLAIANQHSTLLAVLMYVRSRTGAILQWCAPPPWRTR
jgi:hypothetical protein